MLDVGFAKLARPAPGRRHLLVLLVLVLAPITALAANPDRAFALCSAKRYVYAKMSQ